MEKKVKLDSTQKIQLAGAAILLLCVFCVFRRNVGQVVR